MSYTSGRFHREYKQNEISTSDQGKLILMMYDGAIKNLKLAIENMKVKDIANKGTHIRKTRDIINELSLALDVEKGGKVAESLEKLYQFILFQLTLANIKPTDQTPMTKALGILSTLQSAWQEIITNNESQETSQSPQTKRKFAAQC